MRNQNENLPIGTRLKAIKKDTSTSFELGSIYTIVDGDCVGEYIINRADGSSFRYCLSDVYEFFEVVEEE